MSNLQKPSWLTPRLAAAFQDPTVAELYQFRLPYPPETFTFLLSLLKGNGGAVLDVGCGEGAIARLLAPHVNRVDAVDWSEEMIAVGKQRPGGAHPAIHWQVARFEDAALTGPYDLAVAGESIHWLDWVVALPRLARLLRPTGMLAIVSPEERPDVPWGSALRALIARYSVNKTYVPFDVVQELETRRLFVRKGTFVTGPVVFEQSVDDYVTQFHARSSLTRANMGAPVAAEFDSAVRALVAAHGADTVVHTVVGEVVWGKPVGDAIQMSEANI